jgi:transcriptional regulator with XRE-family HTH domain
MADDFPSILSRLRREKRVNQRTAAAALNISQALLSHYENGLREPALTLSISLQLLRRFLRLPFRPLFGKNSDSQSKRSQGRLPD